VIESGRLKTLSKTRHRRSSVRRELRQFLFEERVQRPACIAELDRERIVVDDDARDAPAVARHGSDLLEPARYFGLRFDDRPAKVRRARASANLGQVRTDRTAASMDCVAGWAANSLVHLRATRGIARKRLALHP